jgi:HAD superfamily hydrolase (TIGR01484 family)
MRYLALVSDYDGTLAHDGVVADSTIQAIEHLIHSGRRLILVTGRELKDLEAAFPRLDLCERVVAENGAVVYNPATREKRDLADRPPEKFVDSLKSKGVSNISVGDVIVATWHPYETQAMEAIRESGLELQIIFNKGAVMILPTGVNKKTGLCAALEELKLSAHNVAGIGDAENDHAFLETCECSVAVANAISALKEKTDFVTRGDHGAGVVELIDMLISNDLSALGPQLRCKPILIGKRDGKNVTLPVYGSNVLVCGQSGSGKSTLMAGLLERIMEQKYQMCLIDPEGDYEGLPGCRAVGEEKQAPTVKQVKQSLEEPGTNVVVNFLAVATSDRPGYFASLVADIQELRMRTGRPHWLIIDEAHHVLPTYWAPSSPELVDNLTNVMFITVHPSHISPAALKRVNTVMVVGREPKAPLDDFAKTIDAVVPEASIPDQEPGEAVVWFRVDNRLLSGVNVEPSQTEHHRHRRKYAEGELGEDRSFFFKGPKGNMNLRAQNLNIFMQLADGVDPETWLFHLRRHDYSGWIRSALKDSELANEVEAIESDEGTPERESRKRVKEAILQKYSAPA